MRRMLFTAFALLMLFVSPLATISPPVAAQADVIGPALGTPVPLVTIEGTVVGTVTVNSVEEPFNLYDVYSAPIRGYHYALVSFTVANTGARSLAVDPSHFYMVDNQGFVSSYAYATRTPESVTAAPDFVYTDALTRDAAVTGSLVYSVYDNATIERFLYVPDSERSITIFDLRTTPVAVGTAVSFVGADGQEAAQITVNSIGDPFAGFDVSSPPASGTRFIALNVTVTNTGTRPFYADGYGFDLLDSDGFVAYPTYVYRTDMTVADFPSGDLAPGATATGVVLYVMIEGLKPVKAIYTSGYDRQVILGDITDADLVAAPATGGVTATQTGLGPVSVTPTVAAAAAGDPAICGPIAGWYTEVTTIVDAAFGALTMDPKTATPAELRTTSAVFSTTAKAIEDLDNPDEAQELSDGIVTLFNQLASDLETLANARESGDTAGDAAALAAYEADGAQIFDENSEFSQQSNALTAICPELANL